MAGNGGFKKRLSLVDLTLLGIGSIIGSGWLFGALHGAVDAGNLAWLAWLFGAVAVILIGLVYAELAAAMPRAGGFVRYPQYTHGSLVGWIVGFASMLAYSSVAGVETDAFRQYAAGWIPGLETGHGDVTLLGIVVQILLLVVFFLINYWSVQVFGKINTIVTFFKFIVPIIIIIMLFTHMHAANFSQGGAKYPGLQGVMVAVTGAGIVFSYLGFRQSVDFGAEAKRPQRDIPLAIILSVSIGAVLYLLLQFAFIAAVPSKFLAHGWAGLSFDQPYANIASALGMVWLSSLVFADATISPSGTGNIYMAGTARVLFAWAKKGIFYSVFGKVDQRTGIPRGAMWLSLFLSIAWILPNWQALKFSQWGVLIGAVTSATVLTYMIGPISQASMRKTNPDMPRPFMLKGWKFWSPVAFIFATWIIYWSGFTIDALLVSMTMGSLILYFAFMDRDKEWHKKLKTEWKAAVWLIVYYIFIFGMTRIGSFGPVGKDGKVHALIGSPWDTLIVAGAALLFYYWGVASALPQAQIDTDDEEDEVMRTMEV
ncbi:APC family permease [Alicyclobacillus sp. SO9]|uniref:APC family permease n=1 Tax=Alicyclobacillus sp. SO9 TaxID=2665646 RepID=UPI0018E8AACA|nr:APC family permease [Alicyclobacillus sp. SO9]QQE78300.1 APC family permease [Alicyclobacillus sp. SO9]